MTSEQLFALAIEFDQKANQFFDQSANAVQEYAKLVCPYKPDEVLSQRDSLNRLTYFKVESVYGIFYAGSKTINWRARIHRCTKEGLPRGGSKSIGKDWRGEKVV